MSTIKNLKTVVGALCTIIYSRNYSEYELVRDALPKDWTINSTSDHDRGLAATMAHAIMYGDNQKENVSAWEKEFIRVTELTGPPNESVWFEVLNSLFNLQDIDHRELIKYWIGKADPGFFKSSKIEEILHLAARKGREADIELLLEKGANPNMPIRKTYYSYGSNVEKMPIIFQVESISLLNILLKHGAKIDIKIEGLDLLEIIETRDKSSFKSGDRRDIIESIRSKLTSLKISSGAPNNFVQESLWKSLESSKSWVDAKASLDAVPNWVGLRGKYGENVLMHMAICRPLYLSKTMALRGAKELVYEMDGNSCDLTHYACIRPQSSLTPSQREKLAGFAPKTCEEWIVWHKKYWIAQKNLKKFERQDSTIKWFKHMPCESDDDRYDFIFGNNKVASSALLDFYKYANTVNGLEFLAKELHDVVKDQKRIDLPAHRENIDIGDNVRDSVVVRDIDLKNVSTLRLSQGALDFWMMCVLDEARREVISQSDGAQISLKVVEDLVKAGASWSKGVARTKCKEALLAIGNGDLFRQLDSRFQSAELKRDSGVIGKKDDAKIVSAL